MSGVVVITGATGTGVGVGVTGSIVRKKKKIKQPHTIVYKFLYFANFLILTI